MDASHEGGAGRLMDERALEWRNTPTWRTIKHAHTKQVATSTSIVFWECRVECVDLIGISLVLWRSCGGQALQGTLQPPQSMKHRTTPAGVRVFFFEPFSLVAMCELQQICAPVCAPYCRIRSAKPAFCLQATTGFNSFVQKLL